MVDYIVSSKNIDFDYPLIQISGGLLHLQDMISRELLSKLQTVNPNAKLIVSKRVTSDTHRYFNTLEEVDKEYTYAGVIRSLKESNFEFVPKVEEVGEYSRKGDVLEVWPIGYLNPIRIEFFDEEMEAMYSYDELYGRKIEEIDNFVIGRIDILDDRVEWDNFKLLSENVDDSPRFGFLDRSEVKQHNSDYYIVFFDDGEIEADSSIKLELTYPPIFYSRLDLLEKEIKRLEGLDYKISIATSHDNDFSIKLAQYKVQPDEDLTAGYIDLKNKIVVYTDRELYGTIFITREKQKKLSSTQAKRMLNEIEGEVEVGDYIVHEDHGIGIYSGITNEDGMDYLSIKYAEGDELLVPLDKLHKITKYIGISNQAPDVTRLHRGNWEKVRENTKKKVGIVARELVRHYAKLELASAPTVKKDYTDKFTKFVENFGYEETEDQRRTIKEVLSDIETEDPMNRLIVGDVGFGKTEVAMRAAFKIAEQGLQVAVLSPTTVLAAQHYKVFKDRFEEFGYKVAMMSRFSGKKRNEEIVKELGRGEIDIVVGTHRLLSNDIKFKRLGMVVIDEEQKFGVKQKEKLKKLKYGAHVLTMTATPIPRTLSMALSEIQDISIISTPPKNRRAVKTYVEKMDWTKVSEAIRKEVSRGGQVYFVHNKVQTIDSVAHKLQTLLPDLKFEIGHGQMNEGKLEKVINDFYEEKYDCLVCTTIIENGIDMPNVNTIIIDKAQNFGLGQLYQLRGRVGRSNLQAYAYLFYDGEKLKNGDEEKVTARTQEEIEAEEKKQNKKYLERLKAIAEAQELGAGFKIASRDLEIRGAGNLLGGEQHGQISKVGLALYMQMLAEEIEKVKLLAEIV